MNTYPSITKFQQFVELKDFRPPTKKEYVRYVRKCAEHFRCDPLTLCENQLREYFLFLRQVKRYSRSPMKAAKFSLRSFFVDCHGVTGWTVFQELRIAEPVLLPVVLSREEVAAVLGAVREPRLGVCLELIYHCGLRVGEAVAVQVRDLHESRSPHPRLHVRQGKGGHDRYVPMSPRMVGRLRQWWRAHQHPLWLFPGPGTGWRERGLTVLQAAARAAAQDWARRQESKLLAVPYFLVTFTVPEALRAVIRAQQKIFYAALFRESAGALHDVALSKLGVELGFTGVLHTWTRQLVYHPHVHYLVPGGGLTPDGLRWKRVNDPEFFLPTRVLAARFKNRLRRWLQTHEPERLKQIPAKAWRTHWVVDVQPVGRGQAALRYLAAYVQKTALSPARLLACDDASVIFTYADRATGQTKTLRLSGQEFLRRFLQHVLPPGFQRVRHFGWLSPAATFRWQRIHALLDWKPAVPPLPPKSCWAPQCPRCHKPMRLLGPLARPPPWLR